jgi:hypothetical protein
MRSVNLGVYFVQILQQVKSGMYKATKCDCDNNKRVYLYC